MNRHPDFIKLFEGLKPTWGDQAEKIYNDYVHNEDLDETKPIPIKKQDAISNNPTSIQKTLAGFMLNEQEKYRLIIDRFISDAYNQGIQAAAQELSVLPSEFGDVREQNRQMKILRENSQNLLFNLMDDVKKEIGLLITDASLNNIPFTNAKLKQEVQGVFNSKLGRLSSQITTETDRAFNTALEFGYKKSGLVTHKQWIAIIDANTTSICQRLNGEIAEIGQPFSSGDYTPPAHPNCRSRIANVTLSQRF